FWNGTVGEPNVVRQASHALAPTLISIAVDKPQNLVQLGRPEHRRWGARDDVMRDLPKSAGVASVCHFPTSVPQAASTANALIQRRFYWVGRKPESASAAIFA